MSAAEGHAWRRALLLAVLNSTIVQPVVLSLWRSRRRDLHSVAKWRGVSVYLLGTSMWQVYPYLRRRREVLDQTRHCLCINLSWPNIWKFHWPKTIPLATKLYSGERRPYMCDFRLSPRYKWVHCSSAMLHSVDWYLPTFRDKISVPPSRPDLEDGTDRLFRNIGS
jgi:hypothetical protein